MSRLGLIIQREYTQIVMKKSFIFTTILLPVLMIALVAILPAFLANVKSDEKKTVAVVDNNPSAMYASLIEDTEDYHFVTISENFDNSALYQYYQDNKQNSSIYAIVQIPEGMTENPHFYVYSDQAINSSLERDVRGALRPILEKEKIESFGIDSLENIIDQCKVNIESKTVKWGAAGEEKISSAMIGEFIGMGLSFLTYFFVLMYGAMIMNGVTEEKTNRIVEVIVSTCKPMELMLGKIIGVALVGFTQIIIWAMLLGIAGTILGASALISSGADPTAIMASTQDPQVAEAMAQMQQSSEFAEIVQMILNVNYAQILIFFVVYFIGGYLLYASMFAAFGSAVDQPSDASQFMSPILIIMVFAFYAAIFSIENPDGPLAWWCSIIPFTSPIVMMIRLPYDVPFWEMGLSILLLYGCAFSILFIAGKIYRTGILMYGKKTSFKDILKWIK